MDSKSNENKLSEGLALHEASSLAPFFSIGVTTYNRTELLKQTLLSISRQTFADFEVIVGNDYIAESLTAVDLGIEDSRIRFVNHSKNLGEVGNMNALLGEGRGKYFTWLGDDDLYAPNFLEAVHDVIEKRGFPQCVFTSYTVMTDETYPSLKRVPIEEEQFFTGKQFLGKYLAGKIFTIGAYGVFDSASLRWMGGMQSLSDAPVGLYGEYMLLVRCGLLQKIAFIHAPLMVYRAHSQSWGISNTDTCQYLIAGENLIHESAKVLSEADLKEDFQQNFSSLIKLTLSYLLIKLAGQRRCLEFGKVIYYLFLMGRQVRLLKGSELYFQGVAGYWKALASVGREGLEFLWSIIKSKLRASR